jgi:hypothetical protein
VAQGLSYRHGCIRRRRSRIGCACAQRCCRIRVGRACRGSLVGRRPHGTAGRWRGSLRGGHALARADGVRGRSPVRRSPLADHWWPRADAGSIPHVRARRRPGDPDIADHVALAARFTVARRRAARARWAACSCLAAPARAQPGAARGLAAVARPDRGAGAAARGRAVASGLVRRRRLGHGVADGQLVRSAAGAFRRLSGRVPVRVRGELRARVAGPSRADRGGAAASTEGVRRLVLEVVAVRRGRLARDRRALPGRAGAARRASRSD